MAKHYFEVGDIVQTSDEVKAKIVELLPVKDDVLWYAVKLLGSIFILKYAEKNLYRLYAKCECGSDSVPGLEAFHSSWCPKNMR